MSSSQTPAMWFLTEAAMLLGLSLMCAVAFAQTTGEPARGSTPPGMSQDGSKPADGAIKGGAAVGGSPGSSAIAPGETGGLPNRTPSETAEGKKRCDELTGSLRDECLEKERSETAKPRDPNQILKKPY